MCGLGLQTDNRLWLLVISHLNSHIYQPFFLRISTWNHLKFLKINKQTKKTEVFFIYLLSAKISSFLLLDYYLFTQSYFCPNLLKCCYCHLNSPFNYVLSIKTSSFFKITSPPSRQLKSSVPIKVPLMLVANHLVFLFLWIFLTIWVSVTNSTLNCFLLILCLFILLQSGLQIP